MGRDLLNHERRKSGVGGPTLLLVHPLGANLNFWDECVLAWGGAFTTIAIDLRSAGASPDAAAPPDLQTHVADLLALLDATATDRVVAIGCATGGAVCAALAAAAPERVAALVMANPELRLDADARVRLGKRADVAERHGTEALLPDAVDSIFRGLDDTPRKNRYLDYFRRLDGRRYAQSIRGFLTADVSDRMGQIECPVLLVPAAADTLSGHDTVAEIRQQLPRAQAVVLENAGHFGPYQAPERFAAEVAGFVAKLEALRERPGRG